MTERLVDTWTQLAEKIPMWFVNVVGDSPTSPVRARKATAKKAMREEGCDAVTTQGRQARCR